MNRGAVATLAALLSASSAVAQSLPEVVDGMLAAAERRAEGIESYSVVHNVMGVEATTHFERSVVHGRTILQSAGSSGRGFEVRMGDRRVDDISEYLDALLEHGRYMGIETAEERAHQLFVDDVQAAGVGEVFGPDGTRYVVETAALSVDVDRLVPLRLELRGHAYADGDRHASTTVIEFLDYREVQGLLIPYSTVVTTDGLGGKEDPEAQAQLDDLLARLAEMEPGRRAMIERMMGPEIERMREALSEEGPIRIELVVVDVRVRRRTDR